MEERLIDNFVKGKQVSVEDVLLVVSGIKTPQELKEYKQKIGSIQSHFRAWIKSKGAVSEIIDENYMTVSRARFLFEYLWNSKPRRHGKGYSVAAAIDAQLDPDTNVTLGSCVALTGLYTILCIRENIHTVILASGDHVLNSLKHAGFSLNVENTDPQGFNKELNENYFEELPPALLAASILNSRGIDENSRGMHEEALKSFSKAVKIRPSYASAFNNRGNVYFELSNYFKAQKDYEMAIKLSPDFAEAYCNLGLALAKQSNLDKAQCLFKKVLEIFPQYEDAKRCLEVLEKTIA